MSSSPLARLQQRYGPALDRAIQQRLSGERDPVFLGMMQYQFGYIDEDLRPVSLPAGKRFRPLLCLLACDFTGERWQDALGAGAAIELVHNFSLIHDDIEDHDPARRHRPTVWKVWGEPQAINVGDAVFAEAFCAMLESSTDVRMVHELACAFGTMVLTLTEGQYMDMSFESRLTVSPAEYLAMIERKSAAIIAYSLWSGAVIGGASNSTQQCLHDFGLELGKAFQIHDDILGIWASSAQTGKQEAKDLENRKKTLPLLIAADRAGPKERAALTRFLTRETDDVAEVRRILDATDAYRLAREEAEVHRERGEAALSQSGLSQAAQAELLAVAAELTGYRPVTS